MSKRNIRLAKGVESRLITVRLTQSELDFVLEVAKRRLENQGTVIMHLIRATPLPKNDAAKAQMRGYTERTGEVRKKIVQIAVLSSDADHFDALVEATGGNQSALINRLIGEWARGERVVRLPSPKELLDMELAQISRLKLPTNVRNGNITKAKAKYQQRAMLAEGSINGA